MLTRYFQQIITINKDATQTVNTTLSEDVYDKHRTFDHNRQIITGYSKNMFMATSSPNFIF